MCSPDRIFISHLTLYDTTVQCITLTHYLNVYRCRIYPKLKDTSYSHVFVHVMATRSCCFTCYQCVKTWTRQLVYGALIYLSTQCSSLFSFFIVIVIIFFFIVITNLLVLIHENEFIQKADCLRWS